MNSIGDLLALTPGPSWHECVAIIQEIAAHLEPDQPLPSAEDLLLESDGTITFGFAGESSRPQVADLASLLNTLLEKTDAPKGLRDLAAESATDQPAHSTIASFTRALAFYERPNRASDLQAVAGRLEGRRQTAQADRAIAEIRERIAGKSEDTERTLPAPAAVPSGIARPPVAAAPAAATPPAPNKPDRTRTIARARVLAISAAVILAAVAVSAMTVLRGWNHAGASAGNADARTADQPTSAADETSDKATDDPTTTEHAISTDRTGRSIHHPIGTSATAHEKKSSPARRQPAWSGSSAASVANRLRRGPEAAYANGIAPVSPLPSAPPPVLLAPNPAPPANRPATPARMSRTTEMLALDAPLYTSADPEVTPPVWYRRQLPTEPSPDSKTGYFEIVIDTKGDVESVRLISPTRRYEERMLTAAAKAWKFQPARLNGQPVKYRMRVPITLTWTIDQ